MRGRCGPCGASWRWTSAMMTLTTDAPRTAATAMASTMAGKAIRASIRRMIGLSRAGKNPAVAPMIVPAMPVNAAVMRPMIREIRAPWMHPGENVAAEMVRSKPVGRVRRTQARAETVAERIEGRKHVGKHRHERDRQNEHGADEERATLQEPHDRHHGRAACGRLRCRDRRAVIRDAPSDRRPRKGYQPQD